MKRLNLLLTLATLIVLLVTIERFSFTTKILLQPYSFLRLHEVVQMGVISVLSLIISAFLLKELSNNFSLFKTTYGMGLFILFFIGVYFAATGNGGHEIASFLFNKYCDVNHFTNAICGSMFFDDYYFGNIVYFIGTFCSTLSLVLFERMHPTKNFTKKDWSILTMNAAVYGFTIFYYAGFDRVLVGLWYSIITTIAVLMIFFTFKQKRSFLPYTIYTVLAYTLGTGASILIRLH